MSNKTNPFGTAQIDISEWTGLGYIYIGSSLEMHLDYATDISETLAAVANFKNLNDDPDEAWEEIVFHANGGCAACGTHFAHGAVVRNKVTGDIIAIGGICAETWGEAQAIGMHAARSRKAAANALKKADRAEEAAQTLSDNPGLADAFEVDHPIIRDISGKLTQWGSISPAQVALVFKIAREEETRAADKSEREAQLDAAPALEEGRREISGKVISTKYVKNHYSYYGESILKMLVQEENGNRIFGTVPSSIGEVDAGDNVTFTAAIERSKDDDHFGFYKRPAKGVIT